MRMRKSPGGQRSVEPPQEWQAVRMGEGFPGSVSPANFSELFEEAFASKGYYYLAWNPAGDELLVRSADAPDLPFPGFKRRGYWLRDIPGERRELFHSAPFARMLVGCHMDEFQQDLNRLKIKIALVGLSVVLVAFAVGAYLVSVSLNPLQEIRARSKAVATGKLDERIDPGSAAGSRELEELAADLNATFAALERQFARQVAFTADASHELRTPLTALIAQVRRGRSRTRSQEDYDSIFEICDRSLRRLKRIVDDLTELSSYDSGRTELDSEELDIKVLVQTIIDDLRPLVENHGSTLSRDLEPCIVNCDPFRIEQVLSNLISNAVNHNPRPIRLLVRSRCLPEEAVIEVEDDGIGIPPELCERLCDRFFQTQKSIDACTQGSSKRNSGLGLSISKAIIEAHGGQIEAESTPGEWTVFRIRLPKSQSSIF